MNRFMEQRYSIRTAKIGIPSSGEKPGDLPSITTDDSVVEIALAAV
jgi:hypothetical protein